MNYSMNEEELRNFCIEHNLPFAIEFKEPWYPKPIEIPQSVINDTKKLIEIFKTSYDQAIALNTAIAEDIKVKQNEIASIQTQIEFNQQVAEDNSKYISKLKDLIS